jgi:hypothetical protein
MSARAEESAFVLLALQAPVAGDLRSIVSAIQMVADIDRMGALALHVAKIARRRHPQHALPEEVNGYFAEMGSIVRVVLGSDFRSVTRPAASGSQVNVQLNRGASVEPTELPADLTVTNAADTTCE